MTQESGYRPSSSRRAARAKNRPVLVTPTETEIGSDGSEEQQELVSSAHTENLVEEQSVTVKSSRPRRLAGFFSTVGKRDTDTTDTTDTKEAPPKVDAAQARIARATRGKSSESQKNAAGEESVYAKAAKDVEKASPAKPKASTTRPPARPSSGFKTKYLLGMVLYLLGAQLIGTFVTSYMAANHLDTVLAKNLFGLPVTITTSTVVYLVILVLLLVLLAKLDLIPRSFSAASGNPPAKRGSTSRNQSSRSSTGTETRPAQPVRRQGVKGSHDDLYQAYRSRQRREKKK